MGIFLEYPVIVYLTLCFFSHVVTALDGPSDVYDHARPSQHEILEPTTLGVRVVRPVFATIPITRAGHRNVTVALTIWLRRVGATHGVYDMPHQTKDALRFLVWVDSPQNLHLRVYGHAALPTEHSTWKPRLLVETDLSELPLLEAVPEPGVRQYAAVPGQAMRPYSYRLELPAGAGICFKIIEASYPKHKAPVCIPPAAIDGICDSLAPAAGFSAAKPALYTAIGPIRHAQSTRDWTDHQARVAGRLINYVSYHVAMGASGLLQYTDELMRSYLMRNAQIVELVRRGHLRLVKWDMPERAHDDKDGAGRPLGYNYDQALVSSHALLATSACGANLVLLTTDIDEYIYFPKAGRRWPEPWGACMGPGRATLEMPATTVQAAASAGSGDSKMQDPIRARQGGNRRRELQAEVEVVWRDDRDVNGGGVRPKYSVFKVQRYDLTSSSVLPDDESRLWATPGALPNTTTATSTTGISNSQNGLRNGSMDVSFRSEERGAGGGQQQEQQQMLIRMAPPHPMSRYDLIRERPMDWLYVKQAQLPAAGVVLFFVHEGAPLHGESLLVHHRCMVLLHVPHFFRSRGSRGSGSQGHRQGWRPFCHWMFSEPGSDRGLSEL
ncbi:hypothetical protein VOLCADRAFT_97894 [Volvox carteri f. nagariensis]|uniref:Glycosyltransferase family 92 protein n=1 Tax=Volvox carteri f. nagariensis TaxID=3068 RepID=D8UDX7_VOLCA|nr:uncharacterized protein VOLCADRAFT_97894 [Volvox carteri f. nagariensis]EFJ42124.1 hypothetical protein VOLCADRAFT_97894 [Volvox carteri f. nagariensis]|eukprot:XP_002956821.1 hypothetical protein VOLCADRAFT_97894 [Volvox carteri f. nagariensis]